MEVTKSFLEEAKVEHLTPTEMGTYAKSLSESYEVMDIANFSKMEGRKEGRIEGRKEERRLSAAKLMEVASKLLQTHTPIDDIIFYTGLTRKQIQELSS